MGRATSMLCCWKSKAEVTVDDEARAEELRETRHPAAASLVPRSPCSSLLVASPHPYSSRAEASPHPHSGSPFVPSIRTSPLSTNTSPHISKTMETSPAPSRLTLRTNPPSPPCSSMLRLSGFLDSPSPPHLKELTTMVPRTNPSIKPRALPPAHTCSLCSLIRRHDQKPLPPSTSVAETKVNEILSSLEQEEEEEGEDICKCTDFLDNIPPPPSSSPERLRLSMSLASPTSPLTVKAKPTLAPYFPPSPVEDDAPQQTLADQGQTSNQDDVTPPAENDEVFDPVETQYLTVKNTLDTLLQKRRSPTAMERASHAAQGAERLI